MIYNIDIDEYVKDALRKVYDNDNYLVLNGERNHIHEISVVHRFAHYLENKLKADYPDFDRHFDIEYNKNFEDQKRTANFRRGLRPDFIIHKRNSNEHNYLVIEFKAWWSIEDQNKDIQKVKDLMMPPYNYKHGCVILIREAYSDDNINWINHG